MIKALVFALITIGSVSLANEHKPKQIRIGVVDTGFSLETNTLNAPICDSGSRDFTKEKPEDENPFVDRDGHGSHIVGLIHQQAAGIVLGSDSKNFKEKAQKLANLKPTEYCFVIFKIFDGKANEEARGEAYSSFLKHVLDSDIDLLNMSIHGTEYSYQEDITILTLTKVKGVQVIVAGGNEASVVSKKENLGGYPASHSSGQITVGSYIDPGDGGPEFWNQKEQTRYIKNIALTSNRGPGIDVWMPGVDQISLSIEKNKLSIKSGTSMAAARYTGFLVHKKIEEKKKDEKLSKANSK